MLRLFRHRPAVSRLTYIILFSLYIALALNIVFYRQAFTLLPVDGLHNALVFLSMPVVAFAVMAILLTLASVIHLEKVAATLFVLLSASAQYFMMNFGIIVDRSMITNILDTTPAESYALLSGQMIMVFAFTALLSIALAWWIKIKPAASVWRGTIMRAGTVLVSALLILLVAGLFYKDYASLFRNNKELVKSLNPSNSIVAMNSWYFHHEMDNLPLVKIGEDAKQKAVMKNGPRKNLTILIVGETSRAANFSLGGYERETNPLLAKDNVVYFPKTASCGTATAVSVPCMFSNMPRTGYDESLAHHQEGLLDIIQRAGIQVQWNDNDGGCKGACDRVPHQDVTALNLPGQCINGECYDDVLFHDLEKTIDRMQGDGVIVLHTIGSHGPTYYNRYPP